MRAMSRVFKLFRLQQVDSQLDTVRARLDEIAAILGEDETLKRARAEVESADGVKLAAKKELGRAEDEVKAQQIKIEHNQAALYGGRVTNPKELQDLQLEAEALKRHLASLEDGQLEKMLSLEEGHSALRTAQKALEEIETQRAQEHGELGKEQAQLKEEAQRLERERDAASSGIPDEDLQSYEKLRSSQAGLAVAKVRDKVCSACGTTLSSSLAQAARSPQELSRCTTCKRILYAG